MKILPRAVLVIAIIIAGCASPCQYLRTAEETEANLEAVRSRKNTLEQEVKSLRDLNEKLTAHVDEVLAEMELYRVQERTDTEQEHLRRHQAVLEQQIKARPENRMLQRAHQDVKHRNGMPESTTIPQ